MSKKLEVVVLAIGAALLSPSTKTQTPIDELRFENLDGSCVERVRARSVECKRYRWQNRSLAQLRLTQNSSKLTRRAIALRLPTNLVRLRIRPCVHRIMYFCTSRPTPECQVSHLLGSLDYCMLQHAHLVRQNLLNTQRPDEDFLSIVYHSFAAAMWGHQHSERMSCVSVTTKAGQTPSCIFSYVQAS